MKCPECGHEFDADDYDDDDFKGGFAVSKEEFRQLFREAGITA